MPTVSVPWANCFSTLEDFQKSCRKGKEVQGNGTWMGISDWYMKTFFKSFAAPVSLPPSVLCGQLWAQAYSCLSALAAVWLTGTAVGAARSHPPYRLWTRAVITSNC